MFEQGNIKIINTRCEDWMLQVPDKYFDLAIVDPPYFDGPNKTGYYGKGYSSLGVQRAKHYDTLPEWSVPDEQYFEQLKRISKDQIIWGANHFAGRFDSSSSSWIFWDKDNGASTFADAELAYTSHSTAVRIFKYMWNGMHQGTAGGDVRKNEKRIHPTQKPKALYDWIYLNYARPEFKILDTHLGSGSNAIAAHYFGVAEFVGLELDESMYKAAVENVILRTQQEVLF